MKVGDLVTLSSRGAKLENCCSPRSPWNKVPPLPKCSTSLVGMILEVREPLYNWETNERYLIKWAGDGPRGRTGWDKHFHRCDLKYLSKAKR